ncbi:hypothetical protein FPQ18DRAFT_26692 [Pyronema domesticum]|nr:hypothetical protein FPQ18DRAFT_26692 [Pyronema domesticum]
MRKELSWLEGFLINSLNCQHSCFLGAGSELPVPTWFNYNRPVGSCHATNHLILTHLTVSILIAPFKYPQHNHLARRFAFFFCFAILVWLRFFTACTLYPFEFIVYLAIFFFFFLQLRSCVSCIALYLRHHHHHSTFSLGIIIILLSFYLTSGLGRVWFFDLWFSLMIFFFFFTGANYLERKRYQMGCFGSFILLEDRLGVVFIYFYILTWDGVSSTCRRGA